MTDDIKRLLVIGLNAQDGNGKTPLILAAWRGDLQTTQQLLRDGADVSIIDSMGENVVHYAARQNNLDVLATVLQTSADKNLKSREGYRQTPLFTPATVGNVAVLRILLEHGVDPDIQDKGKFTALQWATQQGKVECIKVLLEYGANINTRSSKKITPLISAAISGVLESAILLVEAGADINAASKDGYTALIYAAYYGHADIVKYLLNKGADRNAATIKGETALTIAEKKKYDAVVAILT